MHIFEMSYTHKMLPDELFRLSVYLFERAIGQELVFLPNDYILRAPRVPSIEAGMNDCPLLSKYIFLGPIQTYQEYWAQESIFF